MNKKLIFRILGALSSALIIVGVFVPFVSISGFSQSLWDTYEAIDSLYLPIMILVFGVVGVIFFSLNIKTEFSYMSTGAVLFFVIMQTIDVANQGMFNTLSIGYYFLCIGALLTGLMAFLSNLKSNNKDKIENTENAINQPTMIDKIDKVYNDEPQNVIQPIKPLDNSIQPIPIQPIQSNELNSVPVQPQPAVVQPIPEIQQPTVSSQTMKPIQDIQPQMPPIQNIVESKPQQEVFNQQLVGSNLVNPVVQQFSQPSMPSTTNPVVEEFMGNNITEPIIRSNPAQTQTQDLNSSTLYTSNENVASKEFGNPVNQGLNISSEANNAGTDIFGQPINR